MTPAFDQLLHGMERHNRASDADLSELQSFAGVQLPADYVALLRHSDGTTGWLRGRYLIIYSTRKVISVNRASKIKDVLPNWLIFASNGGGTSYLFDLNTSQVSSPVYRCEDVDIGAESPELIATSIEEFIQSFGPMVG